MTLTVMITTLIVSYLIPAATSLITKANASTWLKQFVTALLAAANGVIVTATQLDGTAVISKSAVVLALGSFIAAQAAYVGVYKPHNANGKLAPNSGIGGSSGDGSTP